MNFSRFALLASTVLSAACLAGGSTAFAGSGGIASHELSADTVEEGILGTGAGEAVEDMPLVDDADFEALGANAPHSAPSGTAGVDADAGAAAGEAASPEAFGRARAPYSAARVAVTKLGISKRSSQTPVTSAPYRATGKLVSKFGTKTVACTASLIRKGILVTAAHCVSKYGKGDAGFAGAVYWYPSQYGRKKKQRPYGQFRAVNVFVPIAYLDGTDTCQLKGKICNNDVATVVLGQKKVKVRRKGVTTRVLKYAGEILGTYKYGFNGFGFKVSPFLGTASVAQVTQLSYPTAFDGGNQMQRNDAVAWYVENGDVKSLQVGSPHTAGADGSPWLLNFGTKPKFNKKKAKLGSGSRPNVVIGVTSYASKKRGTNLLGGTYFGQNTEFPNKNYSGFGPGNIGALMEKTCEVNGAYC